MLVQLVDRPGRSRRVLAVAWHAHCRQYAYVVETSAPDGFRPYWFASQLALVSMTGAPLDEPLDEVLRQLTLDDLGCTVVRGPADIFIQRHDGMQATVSEAADVR